MEMLKKILLTILKIIYNIIAIASILTIIWFLVSGYYYRAGYEAGIKKIVSYIYKNANNCNEIKLHSGTETLYLINKQCLYLNHKK